MTPPWLTAARADIGLKEIPGPKSNLKIIGWAVKLGGWIKAAVTDDATPWCGMFVAHIFQDTLPALKRPANPLSAAAWALWGIKLAKPALGAVLVFRRPGGGHVGFYEGEDAACYHVLGGNQGNAVSVTRIEKNRLIAGGIRWPAGQVLPEGGPVMLTAAGKPSVNEA